MKNAGGYLNGEPVSLQLWDREASCVEEVGGGVAYEDAKSVVTLLDLNSDWVVYQWEHSAQIVIVPARDVLCISADLPEERQENVLETEADVPSGSVGYNLFADMLERVQEREVNSPETEIDPSPEGDWILLADAMDDLLDMLGVPRTEGEVVAAA